MKNIKQKSIFSYLYATSKDKDMNEILEIIKNNKIECDNEYFDKCKIIKDLFLERIENDMDYDAYLKYKEAIKRLDTNTYYIYIDSLIKILETDDFKLLSIINYERINGSFNCLKDNNLVNIDSSLSIDMLNEIYGNMKLFVSDYVCSLIKDKTINEIDEMYNDIKDDISIYYILFENYFMDKYSYLEFSIYKELYINFLSNLKDILRNYFKDKYTVIAKNRIEKDKVKYYNLPNRSCNSYGYYKKFSSYR